MSTLNIMIQILSSLLKIKILYETHKKTHMMFLFTQLLKFTIQN